MEEDAQGEEAMSPEVEEGEEAHPGENSELQRGVSLARTDAAAASTSRIEREVEARARLSCGGFS